MSRGTPVGSGGLLHGGGSLRGDGPLGGGGPVGVEINPPEFRSTSVADSALWSTASPISTTGFETHISVVVEASGASNPSGVCLSHGETKALLSFSTQFSALPSVIKPSGVVLNFWSSILRSFCLQPPHRWGAWVLSPGAPQTRSSLLRFPNFVPRDRCFEQFPQNTLPHSRQ